VKEKVLEICIHFLFYFGYENLVPDSGSVLTKNSGSGSVMTKNAGSGSVMRSILVRIRNTVYKIPVANADMLGLSCGNATANVFLCLGLTYEFLTGIQSSPAVNPVNTGIFLSKTACNLQSQFYF